MSEIVRFSASIESELLDRFDRYCQKGQFATRSEAIRQIFNETLTNDSWTDDADAADAAATLTIVYDHHRPNLMDQMVELQHRHVGIVVSTTHIHLDHDNCLEVIILRGAANEIQDLASAIRGLKGIKQGQLVLATAGKGGRTSHHHGHDHPH